MRSDPARDQREACYQILAYLADNPSAGDTFEGILEWWLLHQRIKFEARVVSEAVAKLVADGLIVEQKGPGSRTIYRANQNGASIQNTLNQLRASLDD